MWSSRQLLSPGEVYVWRAPSAKTLISGRLGVGGHWRDDHTQTERRRRPACLQTAAMCAVPVMTRGPIALSPWPWDCGRRVRVERYRPSAWHLLRRFQDQRRPTMPVSERLAQTNNLWTVINAIHFIGLVNIDYTSFFSLSQSGLRGHPLKLYQPHFKLDIRKFLFSVRVIDIVWNSSPANVSQCHTV